MNIQQAKEFLTKLHNDGLSYHLEDDAADCLDGVTTLENIETIQSTVDAIYRAELDWADYGCPIGYLLVLMRDLEQ